MIFSLFDVALLIAFALVSALLLAPLEALISWAGWGATRPPLPAAEPEAATVSGRLPEHYLIFLDGISKGSYRNSRYITDFLTGLQGSLPESRVISDVLPYSVFDLELTSRHYPLFRFWTWVERRKRAGNPLGFLINLHNLFQVMVAADGRYGPVYNVRMTRLILERLVHHGFGRGPGSGGEPGRTVPVVIVGYSGGGQVAAGIAPLLSVTLNAPVTVVSIGGVVAGNSDFGKIKRWYQVVSDKDPVEKIGALAFPLRWRVAWFSPWNRAKRRGAVRIVPLNGARHDKTGSYMDERTLAPDGRSLLALTLEIVVRAVREG